ncbi:CCA tRNA nucleotidyltransferase [Altererythrobacter sp. Root672]|uniref:CCA tRNA nucleotidyltransferase n=1 Tax=Altererythrobacter sp. Root672 TaxID=1736584 RepID=UPI0006FE9B86|nr:CCA tRNA nucleotidyltransferase [Altererythrobacter sp. Root672]KRA83814.1 polynucleotide adenylyltransferase [Altererythrobacter sp. Root672]
MSTVASKLPAVAWTARDDLAALVAALGPDKVRWVGGAVRDTLLGHPVADVDAATLHEPQTVIELLGQAGIRAIPTGIDHGTVTAILPGGNVEVTTLRHDVSTDGRRATVAFATEWREDAERRDFTINALYADPVTLEIFDWFGGLADLEVHRVRFIGDARQRIREDHLRILRYYRFQARFGSALDEEAEEACAELAPTLKGLSRERVAMELLNLLSLPDPSATVERMEARGVLPVVLPEAGERGIAALKALTTEESRQGVAPDALRRLAALLPAEPRTAEQVAARLRLSAAQKKRLVTAAAREAEPGEARALAYSLGRDEAIDRLLLAGADVSPLTGWDIPRFPIKGGEIVARGISAGPEVARILREIERRWVAEGFPNPERAGKLLDERLPR